MIPDYHIHTARCGHAVGGMWEYVAEARSKGLEEIGFCDHVPMYWLPAEERNPGLAMEECELPGYVDQVLGMRRSCLPFSIRLGVEVDYVRGQEEKVREILAAYPFDYVVGSVHYIDGWDFDAPDQAEEYRNRDIDQVYVRYFELLCQAAESGLFDIMAHPDLVKKFGYRPRMNLDGLYRRVARAFARAGVCVEVNTAGLRVPAGEIYPAPGFLRICREEGVPATVGSDAHAPDLVGYGFDRAATVLRNAGYSSVNMFSGRWRTEIRL